MSEPSGQGGSGQGPTAQQLILALRERGLSMRDLSTECDRDSSLLYQVASGKRPGTNLLPTLIDLARTGHAARRPERRATKSGRPARIRGRRGQPAHEPPPPTPTAPTPGKFSVQTNYLAGGARTRRITAPKSPRAVGRFDAKQATMDAMAEAAREQRRVAFVVHYADGSSHTLGSKSGYRANDAYIRAQGEWEDAFEWLGQEASAVANRLYDVQALNIPIVGVDVTVFGPTDPLQTIPPMPRPPAPTKKTPAKKTPAKKSAKRPAKRTTRKPPPGRGRVHDSNSEDTGE